MGKINNENLEGESLKKVIDNCRFKPSKYTLLITVNEFKSKEGLEVVSEEQSLLDEWQYVISAGDGTPYKPGDFIYLNLKRLTKTTTDPEDRTKFIEVLDIAPLKIDDKIFTLIPDAYVAGSMEIEHAEKIKV